MFKSFSFFLFPKTFTFAIDMLNFNQMGKFVLIETIWNGRKEFLGSNLRLLLPFHYNKMPHCCQNIAK